MALFFVLFGTLATLAGVGVADAVEESSWGQIKAQQAQTQTATKPTGKYYTVAIRLNVWFVNQLVDGGNWSTVKDCGQTAELLVIGHLRGQCLAASNLTAEKSWLARTYGDNRHIGPDGWYTDVNQLARMAREYWGYVGSYAAANGNTSTLEQELLASRPVIVAVRVGMKTDGLGHFMVLTGIDQNTVWVNDVGRTSGKDMRYPLEQFMSSWGTQNRSYVVIK